MKTKEEEKLKQGVKQFTDKSSGIASKQLAHLK
jgi:hypothetical protein